MTEEYTQQFRENPRPAMRRTGRVLRDDVGTESSKQLGNTQSITSP
jgi:hypothetical protein